VRDLRPLARVFCAARVVAGKRRNKIAVKALKANDTAKSDRSVFNDFNDLQGASGNVLFRLAKDFALFV
jgi:hypothetical protein